MFEQLYNYCRWDWPDKTQEYLEKNPGVLDVTEDECICIRLAISNGSSSMLEDLLKYLTDSLPRDQRSRESSAMRQKVFDAFEEHIDFADLPSEMKPVINRYLPEVVMNGLVYAAASGDIGSIRELYQYCENSRMEEVLASAISNQQDDVVEALSEMALTDRKKAIVFRNAADMYIKDGKPEKAYVFYEKAIAIDSSYQTAYFHYANSIVSHFCRYEDFSKDMALKAESYYNEVTSRDQRYSSAHKKLGILYQLWSQQAFAHRQECEIKALNSYVKAIECKKAIIKYDSVYSEITHLILRNISSTEVQKILARQDIQDKKLQDDLRVISEAKSLSLEDASVRSSEASLYDILEEDAEYEDWSMDSDFNELSERLTAVNLAGASAENDF